MAKPSSAASKPNSTLQILASNHAPGSQFGSQPSNLMLSPNIPPNPYQSQPKTTSKPASAALTSNSTGQIASNHAPDSQLINPQERFSHPSQPRNCTATSTPSQSVRSNSSSRKLDFHTPSPLKETGLHQVEIEFPSLSLPTPDSSDSDDSSDNKSSSSYQVLPSPFRKSSHQSSNGSMPSGAERILPASPIR